VTAALDVTAAALQGPSNSGIVERKSDVGKTTRQKSTACAEQKNVGCANQPVRKQQHAQSKQHSHETKQIQLMKHANNTK